MSAGPEPVTASYTDRNTDTDISMDAGLSGDITDIEPPAPAANDFQSYNDDDFTRPAQKPVYTPAATVPFVNNNDKY